LLVWRSLRYKARVKNHRSKVPAGGAEPLGPCRVSVVAGLAARG
jgi:hypothetical protein